MATTCKRHPFYMDLRVGVKKDGTLSAIQANYVANTGAYTGPGPGVFGRAMLHATGPYHFPHVDIAVTGVFTNNLPAGAMRGFGIPQVAFALESHLDQLAHEIGMDPWELRYRNAYTGTDFLPSGHKIPGNVEIRRCLETIKPYYESMKTEAVKKSRNSKGRRYGVGLGTTMYGTGHTGRVFPGRAHVSLEEDGTLAVRVGVADVGQGVVTSLAQIAADEFEIPIHRAKVFYTDTLTEPDSGPTSASRQIFFTGKAVCSALRQLRQIILDVASQVFERKVDKVILESNLIYPEEDRRSSLPISEFMNMAKETGVVLEAEGFYNPGETFYDFKTGRGRPYPAYGYGVQVVSVSVDEETGRIEVARVVAAQDVGRAINPKIVEGQIEGSILMGIGWALKEKFSPGKTEGFATYPIPRSMEVPEIKVILIESHEPEAPFGAKGAGEAPIVPIAPAVLNAIAHATGVRFYEIPIDSNKLKRKGERAS